MPEEPHDPWFETYRPNISRRGSFHKRWVCSAGPLWLNYVLQCSFPQNCDFFLNVMLNLVETWSFFVINVEIHLGWQDVIFSLKSKKLDNLSRASREKHPNFRKTPTTHVLMLEGWLEMYPGGELCFSKNIRYFSSWASVGPTSAQMRFFYYFLKDQYQKNEPKNRDRIFVKIGRWYL